MQIGKQKNERKNRKNNISKQFKEKQMQIANKNIKKFQSSLSSEKY